MQRTNFAKLFGSLKRFETLNNRRLCNNRNLFVYGKDVEMAKRNNLPIVALESTIITHGMPYPDNLKTAIKVEDVIRKKNAVPATIGILKGQIHVGLNREQLEVLSTTDEGKAVKCSRRDISWIMSQKLNGGTTVSATMLVANLAGIPIMATGGIGGVHRGAELSFDVSTDLVEIGRTPVAVVCSGVKSILDISKTLEYLETQGVPVIKIGDTEHFPAFYSTETFDKIKAPYRVSTSEQAARIVKAQRELGLGMGILFAVPIPTEYALNPKVIESAISKALENARHMNITGKNVTPFLLEEVNKITHGQSLQANMALIENNANIAAEIAVNLAERHQTSVSNGTLKCLLKPGQNPVVIGGATMDTTLQVTEAEIRDDGRTHAGRSRESCGGVGRNIANALISLGLNGTRLISVVGNDQPGKAIIKSLGDGAQTVDRLSNISTARYTLIVNSKGECCFGIAEMEAFTAISPDLVKKHYSHVESASFIILDGNIPLNTIHYILDIASCSKIPVWYEPTDVTKATKVFEASPLWQDVLHFISPNKNELVAIGKYLGISVPQNGRELGLDEVQIIGERLAEFIPVVVATLGAQGVFVTRKAPGDEPFYDDKGRLIESASIASRLYPPLSDVSDGPTEVRNVSGCGDCLTSGMIYGIHKRFNERNCLSLALKAAAVSLTSSAAVPVSLSMLRNATEYAYVA